MGFSLGSLIALDFASKFQHKLKSLTLIGTTYKRTAEQRALVIERFESQGTWGAAPTTCLLYMKPNG